jgi:hypothetical protein
MPATIGVASPSGDTTGTTDSANIAAAIAMAGDTGKIILDSGHYFLSQPIQTGFLTGFTIEGAGGGINGRTSKFPRSTTLSCGTAFSTALGTEVIGFLDGSCGPAVKKLCILGDANMPASVDGIACHRNVNGLLLEEVSIALVTGHGVAWFQGSDGVDGDACKMKTVMIQQPGFNAVHRWPPDSTLIDVHTQYAGYVDGVGAGFFSSPSSSGNSSLIGCRADLSFGPGYVLDHNGAFGDCIKLTGCSTERNAEDGVLITNSSPTGGDWRVPINISGCSFEGDGHNNGLGGDYAAIRVQGRNQVYIDNTVAAVNNLDCTAGAPKYSLYLQQIGSSNRQAEIVSWASGRMNYSGSQAGAEAIHNHSLVDHLKLGTTLVQIAGYEGTSIKERSGFVTTSGLTATVTTPWAFANSGYLLTPVSAASTGVPRITNRTNGTFTITVPTADGQIFWQIV